MHLEISKILRNLPSVSDFLQTGLGSELIQEFGEGVLKLELRQILDEIRSQVRTEKKEAVPGEEEIGSRLRERLIRLTKPLGRKAINATGIILHTNLGRAPLCEEAMSAVASATHYSLLEIDLETGKRSQRDKGIEPLIMELTGCEAATVVNNNAAATMIILNTLFKGKEVMISRGQLVEIGGAFRMPDVMQSSGAIMREVGTTNRTHLADYEDAFTDRSGGIIHVHNSNYRIRGFSGTPDIRELCVLGKTHNLPVVDDLGSGALTLLSPYGLPDEPLVQDSIKAGADAVCFSGDKLIGGAQAGIICGKKELIQRIRGNPFARMFRVDKMTLTALQATLVHLINGDLKKIPFYQMLSRSVDELEAQAQQIIQESKGIKGVILSLEDGLAFVGSGSIPDEGIPGKVVRITAAPDSKETFSVEGKARQLRHSLPSVFCRIKDDTLLFDMRTVQSDEVELLVHALKKAFSQ